MNELQKTLISMGAIIVIGLLIYITITWYIKSRKHMTKNKMLTMNLAIKYKLFLEYLSYQEKQKSNYYLILLRINNLNQIERKYPNDTVRSYLTMIVKELSVYLPFGGKIAQTPKRDTLIMYYPAIDEDPYTLGKQFQLLAQNLFYKQGVHIGKTNSVALIDSPNLENLSYALIGSVRSLGEPVIFDASQHHLSEEFIQLNHLQKNLDYTIKSYQVETLKVKRDNEIYNRLFVGDLDLFTYLNKLPIMDQSWVNMDMMENILGHLYDANMYANINLPVLFHTVASPMFTEYLSYIVKTNQFLLENIILSVKLTSIENEDQLIKNILTLSNLGVKVSLILDDIYPNIYQAIQKYHVKRIEIVERLLNHDLAADLLYFAKVNHIEVLYKTSHKTVDESNLHVTHMTKDEIHFQIDKKKRGRK